MTSDKNADYRVDFLLETLLQFQLVRAAEPDADWLPVKDTVINYAVGRLKYATRLSRQPSRNAAEQKVAGYNIRTEEAYFSPPASLRRRHLVRI